MYHAKLTPEMREIIHNRLQEKPDFMIGALAQELGTSDAVVATALPEDMRRFAPAGEFEMIWETMTRWEKITFIAISEGAIVEVRGTLPKGRFGQGFFNLMDKSNPLSGHLRVDRLAAICFLSKQFFGMESHSVQFYDDQGRHLFAVYVGREGREPLASVRQGFFELRDAVSIDPSLEASMEASLAVGQGRSEMPAAQETAS